jgi:hypothetical protein
LCVQATMHRYLYLGTGVPFRFDGEGLALRMQPGKEVPST